MKRLTLLGLACALLLGPADAQDRDQVFEKHAAFRAGEQRVASMALELRRLQINLIEARRALAEFGKGKTKDDLERPKLKARAQQLLRAELEARSDYEAKGQGEAGARYDRLRGGLPAQRQELTELVDACLAATPTDLDVILVRAELRLDGGFPEDARADADAVLAKRAGDAAALTLLARCEEAVNALEGAAALYARAIAAEPTDVRQARHALTLLWLNRPTEARAARDAIKAPSELPAALRIEWEGTLAALERVEALWQVERQRRTGDAQRDDLPRVELVTKQGSVVLELFADDAPKTVAYFLGLVGRGFYDGLPWHRVTPAFAQTGDPTTGPKGPAAKRERPQFRDEGAPSRRPLFRGTVALDTSAATGTSAFMILLRPAPSLGARLTGFGRVVEGLDVVGRLDVGDLVDSVKVLRKGAVNTPR